MSFVHRLIFGFLIATIVSILPLPHLVSLIRPQLVVLLFLYLQLYANTYFYMTLLLAICLLLDVLHANILGQHALAMLLTCLVMVKRSRRFQFFPEAQQILTILFLVLLYNIVFSLTGWLFSHVIAWVPILLTAVSSAACWPMIRMYFGFNRSVYH